MILLFFGNDAVAVRKKANERVRKLEAGEVTMERMVPETYESGRLRDLALSSSLFEGKQGALLDMLSDDVVAFESLLEEAELLAESENVFVVIEGVLNAAQKKKLLAHASEHLELTGVAKERFNSFALADALSLRDKKTLWLLLMRAWQEGLSPEEIIGTLFWQVKMLRLAERTKSAAEAGQKPYVYDKAKRALSNFKKGELDQISRELLMIYHDGHQGKRDIDLGLEKWVLCL